MTSSLSGWRRLREKGGFGTTQQLTLADGVLELGIAEMLFVVPPLLLLPLDGERHTGPFFDIEVAIVGIVLANSFVDGLGGSAGDKTREQVGGFHDGFYYVPGASISDGKHQYVVDIDMIG